MLRRSVLLKVWLFEQKCAFTWKSHTVLALSIFGVAGEMGMEMARDPASLRMP